MNALFWSTALLNRLDPSFVVKLASKPSGFVVKWSHEKITSDDFPLFYLTLVVECRQIFCQNDTWNHDRDAAIFVIPNKPFRAINHILTSSLDVFSNPPNQNAGVDGDH